MRRVRFTDTARAAMDGQIDYLISVGAFDAADRLQARCANYIAEMIAQHPRAAKLIPERELWES